MPTQRRYALFLLLTLTVCTLAIYIHRHRQGQTGRIDNLIIGTTGALQKTLFYFSHGTRTLLDNYIFLVNVKKKNEELARDLEGLKARLASMQETEQENLRLREALAFKGDVSEKLIAAHVIAHDVSSDYVGIRIDRGSDDGVQLGMGVISASGVVGRVHRVSPRHCDVMTLVDPASAIDGIIQRSRARGIVAGESKELTCRMKYVDRLDDVAVNDAVLSTGFGGIFPKGLLIGYVSAVIPSSNGILQTVNLKSAVDIYRLEEVFVVIPSEQQQKTS